MRWTLFVAFASGLLLSYGLFGLQANEPLRVRAAPYCPVEYCAGWKPVRVVQSCYWDGTSCQANYVTINVYCPKDTTCAKDVDIGECVYWNGACRRQERIDTISCCEKPPPTPTPRPRKPRLSLNFDCRLWGNDRWCRSDGRIVAVGTDPRKKSIEVTGTTGGPSPQSFSCTGTDTCTATASVAEGTGTAEATATNNRGSVTKTVDWKYDPTAPTLNYSFSPANPDGQNGWYVTNPQANVQGSDATSGVAIEAISIDNGPWTSPPVTIGTDGTHRVDFSVTDVAGNRTIVSVTIQVDTTPPTLSPSISPSTPDGRNGWYVTQPEITVNASDATSGVAAEEVSLDGGSTWASAPFTVPDGVHDVRVRARDVAGNTASQSLGTLRVDTVAPSLTVNDPGTLSCVSHITGRVEDATSGVAGVFWSRDGGATWESITTNTSGDFAVAWDVRSLPEGAYVVHFRAQDVAGNTVEVSREVWVRHPNIGIGIRPKTGYFWDTFRIGIGPDCMKIIRLRVLVENPDGPNAILGDWDTRSWDQYGVEVRWNGMFPDGAARSGTYWLRVDVYDTGGRVLRDYAQITVPVFGPVNTPTPLPTFTATPTPQPTATPTTGTKSVLVIPTSVPEEKQPEPTSPPPPPPSPSPLPAVTPDSEEISVASATTPLVLIGTLAFALGILGLRDPRVPEVARLRRLIAHTREYRAHLEALDLEGESAPGVSDQPSPKEGPNHKT